TERQVEKRSTSEENESSNARVIQRGWVSFTLAGWVRIRSVLTMVRKAAKKSLLDYENFRQEG
ncbi:hypothetical protein, partial [Serratia ficaria]|uniref:hypothetical protein n=1 Tax=Serratia ficaria TaxID=61651 RepID=UPI0021C93661